MRSFILVFFIILSTSLLDKAHCQVWYGFKGGANLANGKFEQIDTDFALRFHVGILAGIPLSEKFYLRPELLWSQKGWKIPDDNLNDNVSVVINYLNLPIMVGFKPFDAFSISTGPELGLKLNAKREPSGSWADLYETFDIGWAGGCSYFPTSKIGFDIRYVYGFKGLVKGELRDSNNNVIGTYREGSNQTVQLSMVYLLNKSPKE